MSAIDVIAKSAAITQSENKQAQEVVLLCASPHDSSGDGLPSDRWRDSLAHERVSDDARATLGSSGVGSAP